ncbi:thermonuclease family protein [Sporolactobacillus sp. STCC-11]|uniref:thermonuclease family protein n=1 Tax=Sporolactobacillus caesalpiniae TaxID=3230362 RepID=UPI003395E18C
MKKSMMTFIGSLMAIVLLSGCAQFDESGQSDASSATTPSPESSTPAESASTASGNSQVVVNKVDVPRGAVNAKVIKVVDGDTLQVLYQKKISTVRVLLIDTPETHHPKLGVQPYGPEASAHAHQLLDGKTVALELAKNGGRDKYGRMLAYVFVNGRSFEELQLASGLARVAYVYPPNTNYVDQYRAIEAQAKKKKIGIWSVSGYAEANGFHPDVMKGTEVYKETQKSGGQASSSAAEATTAGQTSPTETGDCNGAIKGNVSSRGKIYHMPSDRYYKVTKAELCFKSRKDAEKAGFRAAK